MRPICAVFCAALAWAIGLAGCQNSAPHPQTDPAQRLSAAPDFEGPGNLNRGEWSEAARLYTAKCARCHKFYDPAEYDDTEWRMWMSKMSRKSRLKPDQTQLLSRYLETFRASGKSDGRKPAP